MGKRNFLRSLWIGPLLFGLLALPATVLAKEVIQEWEVINPAGVLAIKPVKPAPRITSLEGKTVILRWNGKHNGNNYLERIAELFAEKRPGVKVIKVYEVDKSTIKISGSNAESARIAKVIKDLQADIVIASQAD